MKYSYWVTLFFILLIEPSLVHANTTFTEPGLIKMSAENNSKEFLCTTFNAMRGDLGLIIGLIIGFIGYLSMTTQNMKFSGFLMILFGICLTAFPNFFITTLNGIIALGNGDLGIFNGTIPNPC